MLQISSLLGHKSLAKYLATSSRYIWYWCIGQLSVYSLTCVASGEREKRCENTRITKTRAKPAFSALYSSRLCRSFARSTSKTASYTGYNFDEINEKFRPLPSSPTPPPRPTPNRRWENGAFCPLRSFTLDLEGIGAAVPIYSAKIAILAILAKTTSWMGMRALLIL